MGVTIHFQGRLKEKLALGAVLVVARQFADDHQWPWQLTDKEHVTLERSTEEREWRYEGPVRGIELQPHRNSEPFRLEFDSDLYV